MEKKQSSGRLCIILAALFWGLAGVCVKSISWGTMPQIASRSLLSLIVIGVCMKKTKLKWSKVNILGAVAMSLTGILYVQAIKLTTAGTAIVLQYIAPILVFLYEVIFRHRKAKLMEILITVGVFGGIILSFADSLDPTRIVGNILGLLSGFTFAAQIVIMNDDKADSSDSLMISCLLSFVVTLPFALFDKSLVFDTKNILWILILGIFQYGMANVLFGIGIKRVEALESSLLLTLEPIFNPIPVAIFCGEMMGTKAIIGSVIVIVFITLHSLLPKLEKKKA